MSRLIVCMCMFVHVLVYVCIEQEGRKEGDQTIFVTTADINVECSVHVSVRTGVEETGPAPMEVEATEGATAGEEAKKVRCFVCVCVCVCVCARVHICVYIFFPSLSVSFFTQFITCLFIWQHG